MSIIEGRNAEILQSIIDGKPYENTNPYPSRIEQLLMELKEVIEEGGGATVDQTYTPTSENAQSGTAVAEALETIPSVTVDQTFNGTSANAQSGVAVQQAISSNVYRYIWPSPQPNGTIISSLPFTMPDQTTMYHITIALYAQIPKPASIPTGRYIANINAGTISVWVNAQSMNITGVVQYRSTTQRTVGDPIEVELYRLVLIRIADN